MANGPSAPAFLFIRDRLVFDYRDVCEQLCFRRGAAALVTVPTCMLAGCFWPVELMPEFLQKAAYFIPQRWALDCLVKLQEGRSFGSLYWHLLILLAFALTFFLLAVYKFSRSQQSGQFI
ncbi:ABC-2 family transporter protein [Geobacillus sp. BCO2]|nr:ABC-2 family transporter protein [Geobacillus sp. BCO2]